MHLYCFSHKSGLTDRWGCYREVDATGKFLIAKSCNGNDTKKIPNTDPVLKGCPNRYNYHLCGCACPYFHAQSKSIGDKLVRACRNWPGYMQRRDKHKILTPWEYSIHFRDRNNNPSLVNLPILQGLAKTKNTTGSDEYSHFRIDAYPDEVAEKVQSVTRQILEAWAQMPE